MKEDFLHYVWLYQLFDKTALQTTSGETLKVFKAGLSNDNSGPDFMNSHIQINQQLWVGTVEVHLKSSDWYTHHHEMDSSYENVILHVVWEDDLPVFRKDNSQISTLELKGTISKSLLDKFNDLNTSTQKWISCESFISKIDAFTWQNWLERLFFERLKYKTGFIHQILIDTQNNWEKVFHILLAKNFGLKINGETFFEMASSLDYSSIQKEKFDAKKLEALFFGTCNLLSNKSIDLYQMELQEIYRYQKHKYNLKQISITPQFFRLRPSNFPTIRLSQLANLISKQEHLFERLMHANDLKTIYELLNTKTLDYWETHYVFGKEHTKKSKKTSIEFIDLLIINTIIPLKFIYQNYLGSSNNEIILDILSNVKPEKNHIIEGFKKLGLTVENALHSQSVLTLKNDYCDAKNCLKCAIGLKILNK